MASSTANIDKTVEEVKPAAPAPVKAPEAPVKAAEAPQAPEAAKSVETPPAPVVAAPLPVVEEKVEFLSGEALRRAQEAVHVN